MNATNIAETSALIGYDDIITAYRKFKSYIYNENFSLPIKVELASYEASCFDDNIANLILKVLNKDEHYFDKLIEGIDSFPLPKGLKNENSFNKGVFFTNIKDAQNYTFNRVTSFIKCPIELHLISVLWTMRVGQTLDGQLNSTCYANRLERNSDNDFYTKGIKLFKRYYFSYNDWRNKAIRKAKKLHESNVDTAILNLDIKDYYHSIDYDLSKIPCQNADDVWLNSILQKVHEKYAEVLFNIKIIPDKSKKILPIGLLSSSILANCYLKEFDSFIQKNINPAFYGRYVDDILIVFNTPSKFDHFGGNPIITFIDKYLVNGIKKNPNIGIQKSIVKNNNIEEEEYTINYFSNKLKFQPTKVKLLYFSKEDAVSLLDEFEENIRKNSSEFRLLPEADNLFESFDRVSSSINYSDSINKIRSIEGFSFDKLHTSKHLSFIISSTRNITSHDEDGINKICKNITDFFKGADCLELNSLWEKIFTFFIINKKHKELFQFTKVILNEIEKICLSGKDSPNETDLERNIKASFVDLMLYSLSMAVALDIPFYKKQILIYLKNDYKEYTGKSSIKFKNELDKVYQNALNLIHSNLFRHNYIYYPLINYCKIADIENFSFVRKEFPNDFSFKLENFNDSKFQNSPRFIHYHEICWLNTLSKIYGDGSENDLKGVLKDYLSANHLIEEDVNHNYQDEENPLEGHLHLSEDTEKLTAELTKELDVDDNLEKRFYSYPKLIHLHKMAYINIGSDVRKDGLKIGLANIKVKVEDSINSFKGKPNLNFKRYIDLCNILNEAVRNNCDLIVFPEISIPFDWVNNLTDFSKKNSIGIVFGIEHVANKKREVFNYVAAILPFKYGKYKNAYVDIRLKKDYSHGEEEMIIGNNFFLPNAQMSKEFLRIYDWNNFLFSVFNCFEFCDIKKRVDLKGNVDFVAIVEYNQDTNYFSNITESIARDLHTYIIQVNNSSWGDSRITRPSDTATKDILRIKGGEHNSLITGFIKIKELREFQNKKFSLQQKDKSYKPTPPDFDLHANRKPW